MDSFKAFRIDESGDGIAAGFADLTLDDLSPGEVVVRVTRSTINYKDALAATGTAKILRRYPLGDPYHSQITCAAEISTMIIASTR